MTTMDLMAAQSWLYPSNYPYREYQKCIVETALFNNTLVCLPTGLGKTLIAAVVMYNYYHWFPEGQVIFMAPTKPLVSQQIEACHSIVGIPERDTAHLFGAISPENREQYWRDRRVVFCTPQSLHNDLKSGICSVKRIVCVVFDEAHRATGNYAYCQVVKYMESRGHSTYRVLALSATPGNDAKAIQKVIYNLKIGAVEVRGEDDEDVAQYTNLKQIEIVKCRKAVAGTANDFSEVKRLIYDVMRPPVTHLYRHKGLFSDTLDSLTEFVVREGEDNLNRELEYRRIDEAMFRRLSACLRMVGCLVRWKTKLLASRGDAGRANSVLAALSGLLEYMTVTARSTQGSPSPDLLDVTPVISSDAYQRLMSYLQHCVDTQSFSSAPNDKLEKLEVILEEHFQRYTSVHGAGSTRAIVFCDTRATVQECVARLVHTTGVHPAAFVGQTSSKSAGTGGGSRGLNQQAQEQILESFRAGLINVLVATCIAEEGLDIGEVDLIVCYDSVSSPLRLMQRMGRTGRKRSGRVVMLVVEGKDAARVDKSGTSADSVLSVLKNSASKLRLNKSCPRMLPPDVHPFYQLKDLSGSEFDRNKIGGLKPKPVTSKPPSAAAGGEVQLPLLWPDASERSSAGVVAQPSSPGQMKWYSWQQSSGPNPNTAHNNFWDSVIGRSSEGVVVSQPQGGAAVVPSASIDATVESISKGQCLVCGAETTATKQMCGDCLRGAAKFVEEVPPVLPIMDPAPVQLNGHEVGIEVLTESRSPAPDHDTSDDIVVATTTDLYSEAYAKIVNDLKASAVKYAAEQEEMSLKMRPAVIVMDTKPPCFLRGVVDLSPSTHAEAPPLVKSLVSVSSMNSPTSVLQGIVSPQRSLKHSPLGRGVVPRHQDKIVWLAQRYLRVSRDIEGSPGTSLPAGRSRFPTPVAICFDKSKAENTKTPTTTDMSCTAISAVALCGAPMPTTEPKRTFLIPSSSSSEEDDDDSAEGSVEENNVGSDNNTSVQPAPVAAAVRTMQQDSVIDENPKPKPKKRPIQSSTRNIADSGNSLLTAAPKSSMQVNVTGLPHSSKQGSAATCGDSSLARSRKRPIGGTTSIPKVARCSICTSDTFSINDPMLKCVGTCDCCVHTSCYGLFVPPRMPWKCEFCTVKQNTNIGSLPNCAICEFSTGLLRRAEGTNSQDWVHPICVIFTPELTLNTSSMRANNVSMIDNDRKGLCCSICRRFGGCIQCAHAECRVSIHPYCAFRSGKQLIVTESCDFESDNNTAADHGGACSYRFFCDIHLQAVGRLENCSVISTTIPLSSEIKNRIEQARSKPRPGHVVPSSPMRAGCFEGTPRSIKGTTPDDSPSFFQDTPEHIARSKLQAVQRKRLQKLSRLSDVHPDAPKESDSSKKRKRDEKRRKRDKLKKKLRRFIEDEASCSEDASSRGSCDRSDEDELSGDFINNGAFTQASPTVDTGMSMYHALHKKFIDDSPGISDIKRLLGARGKRRKSSGVGMPVLESVLSRRRRGSESTSEHGQCSDADFISASPQSNFISQESDGDEQHNDFVRENIGRVDSSMQKYSSVPAKAVQRQTSFFPSSSDDSISSDE